MEKLLATFCKKYLQKTTKAEISNERKNKDQIDDDILNEILEDSSDKDIE